MSTQDYSEARRRANALTAEAVTVTQQMREREETALAFQQAGEAMKARTAAREALELRERLGEIDAAFVAARRSTIEAAYTTSAALRAKAEASLDDATRTADEMERARLSTMAADDLVFRAAQMLDAGQARRAAFYLAVANDRGAGPASYGDLGVRIEEALDQSHPDRKEAAAIEQSLSDALTEMDANRLRLLAVNGLGVDLQTGAAGNGKPEQVVAARVGAKLAAYHVARAAGTAYESSPEDGAQVPAGPPGSGIDTAQTREVAAFYGRHQS